jgi:WD40 repeat protein
VSTVTVESLSHVRSIVHLPLTGGFATGHDDLNDIRVWTSEGVLEATLEGHTAPVYALAVRGCGGLVSASYGFKARVWSGTACVAVLKGHTGAVLAVAVHPSNDNIVVTGSADRTVRVWDVASSTCTAVLRGHTSLVQAVAFLSDGSIVSAGSYDKTVRVWSPDGSCKSVLEHPSFVRCLTVLPVEKSKWCKHHWSCGPGAHCSVLFAVRMHTVCVWVCKHKRNTKQIGRVGECGAEVCGEGLVRSQCLYHHRFVSRARLMRLRCASSLDSPQTAWVRDVAVEVVAVGSWRSFELAGP